MENLQELVGQIEEIKDKITDKQYKDILELTKKMNDEKDIGKYILVKRITFKSTVAYQQEYSTNIITNSGNTDSCSIGNKCCDDEDCDCNHEEKTISFQVRHNVNTEDLTLKVVKTLNLPLWRCDSKETGIEDGEIAEHTYKNIKKDIVYTDGKHNYIFIKDL
mgnify:FL=1|tara:strand:+ start:2058 stop:2546 length:489 start_codon:yes stop_codon:yes gene_type:complete